MSSLYELGGDTFDQIVKDLTEKGYDIHCKHRVVTFPGQDTQQSVEALEEETDYSTLLVLMVKTVEVDAIQKRTVFHFTGTCEQCGMSYGLILPLYHIQRIG